LLRLMRCTQCHGVMAVCDECELLWTDLDAVTTDPLAHTAGAFPKCPHCGANPAAFEMLTKREIEQENLERYIVGQSS
jgi:hypothetical protein